MALLPISTYWMEMYAEDFFWPHHDHISVFSSGSSLVQKGVDVQHKMSILP